MFGSRKTSGAAIIPLTAPSTAAMPQPSASIQPTRIPTSRLSAGFVAAARNASPSFVNRNSSHSSATSTSDTAMMPRSWIEKATPATWIGRVENGLLKERTCAPQIHADAPLKTSASPSVTITIVSTDAFSTGRITVRSSAIPPPNAIRHVSRNAGQYVMWCISDQAMNVVKVAISPCAKLMTPVER